jgi:hypothetical protein
LQKAKTRKGAKKKKSEWTRHWNLQEAKTTETKSDMMKQHHVARKNQRSGVLFSTIHDIIRVVGVIKVPCASAVKFYPCKFNSEKERAVVLERFPAMEQLCMVLTLSYLEDTSVERNN